MTRFLLAALAAVTACSANPPMSESAFSPGPADPSTVTAQVGGRTFRLEVADAMSERTHGLMGRTDIEPDGGMIFVWSEPEPRTFWMRDTPTPLWLLYLDSGCHIAEVHPLEPFDESRVPSAGDMLYAIEIRRDALDDAAAVALRNQTVTVPPYCP